MEAVMPRRRVYDYSQMQGREMMADDPLGQLEAGMFIMLAYPKRVARVDRIGTRQVLEEQAGGRPEWVPRPCAYATVTVASLAIEGFVDDRAAKSTTANVESLLSIGDAGQWTEVWAVRSVKRLVNPPGVAARRDSGKDNVLMVGQLYCVSQTGRTRAEKSSPVTGTVVEGDVIPSDAIPPALFRTPEERRRDAVDAKTRVEARKQAVSDAATEAEWAKQVELAKVAAREQAKFQAELAGHAGVAEENEKLRAELEAMKTKQEPALDDTVADEPAAEPAVAAKRPEDMDRPELLKFAVAHGVPGKGKSADIIAQLRDKESA